MSLLARLRARRIYRIGDAPYVTVDEASWRLLLDAVEAAQALQRIFDSVMADENDGTYRLYTDADLHNANTEARRALAPFAGPEKEDA